MPPVACVSHSAEETRSIGAAVVAHLHAGDVVILDGDLGAGKTAFVQGAARALGVTEQVTSPSFVLVRTYDAPVPVVHVDVYRLTTLQELYDLGFEEVFDPGSITFVEWGDAVADELPSPRVHVEIRGDDERTIAIDAGERTPLIAEALRSWR